MSRRRQADRAMGKCMALLAGLVWALAATPVNAAGRASGLLAPDDVALVRAAVYSSQSLDEAQAKLVKGGRPDLWGYLKHDSIPGAKATLDNLYRDGVIEDAHFDKIKALARQMEPSLRGQTMQQVFGVQDKGAPEVLAPSRSGTNPVDADGRGKGVLSDEDMQTKSLEQYNEIMTRAKTLELGVTEVGPNRFKIEALNTIVWKPTADTYQKSVRFALDSGLPVKVFGADGNELSGMGADEIVAGGLRVQVEYGSMTMTLQKPAEPANLGERFALGYQRAGDPEYASGANPDLAGRPKSAAEKWLAVEENTTKGGVGLFGDLNAMPHDEAMEKLRDAAKDVTRSMKEAGLDGADGFKEQFARFEAFRNLELPPGQMGEMADVQGELRATMRAVYQVAQENFQQEYRSLLEQVPNTSDPAAREALLGKITTMQQEITYLATRFDDLSGRYHGEFAEMAGGAGQEAGFKDLMGKARALDEGARVLKGSGKAVSSLGEGRPGASGEPGKPEVQGETGPGQESDTEGPGGAEVLNVFINVGQFVACMQNRPDSKPAKLWAMSCLDEQAVGYAKLWGMGLPFRSVAFFLARAGYSSAAGGALFLGEATVAGFAAYGVGGQVGEAAWEGKLWWDALTEESRAEQVRDATLSRHVPLFARLLGKEEQLVKEGSAAQGIKGVRDITKEREQLQQDIGRIIREAPLLLQKAPEPGDFELRVQDYMRRLIAANAPCAGAANVNETDIAKALRLARSCKSADELKAADEAFQRALPGKLTPAVMADAGKLLDEVALYGNAIKAFAEPAEELSALRAGLPARLTALDEAVKKLNEHHQTFLDEFPAELLEMEQLNSGRLQHMADAIRMANGGGPGEHASDSRRLAQLEQYDLDRLIAYQRNTEHHSCLAGCNFHYVFDQLVYQAAQCKGIRNEANFNAFGGLRSACATKLGKGTATAAADDPENQTFKPVYLFRIWDDDQQHGVRFLLYARADGGNGWYVFPDGNGGVWHQRGESLGQYRDARSMCAVLRGYGVYSVSYNLDWDPHVSCNHAGPIAHPAPVGNAPAAAPTAGGVMVAGVSGPVVVHGANGQRLPLAEHGRIPYGALLETGAGAHLNFISAGGTTVSVEAGSQFRIEAPAAAGLLVTLLKGSAVVDRPAGRSGMDDVVLKTRDGSANAIGTRYRVTVSDKGTAYEVQEGVVQVSGGLLARTDAAFAPPDKAAFQGTLELHAGEHGFAFNTRLYPGVEQALAGNSPLARPDPWNDARVQQLIDDWFDHAVPPMPADRPGPWSYSRWGQLKGPGITIAGAPDHPAGWTRYQTMFAVRAKYDSLNLCTLGEYLERQLTGRGLEGCRKAAPVGAQAPRPPQTASAKPVHGLLTRIDALPDGLWVAGRPNLAAPGFHHLLVLAFVNYDPFVAECGRAALRKGMAVAGLTPRNDFAATHWPGPPPFPIALSAKARDALYAIEVGTGRQPTLNPIPLGYGYLIDADGRVVQSGPCVKMLGVTGASGGRKD